MSKSCRIVAAREKGEQRESADEKVLKGPRRGDATRHPPSQYLVDLLWGSHRSSGFLI